MSPLLLTFLAAVPAGVDLRYELDHDFRVMPMEPTFRLVGADAKEHTRLGPNGLVIKLPAVSKPLPATGVVARPAIEGDFEITAVVEVLNIEKPDSGFGSGATLFIQSESENKRGASLARSLTPKGETVYVTNRISEVGGKRTEKVSSFPARPPRFRLRMTRAADILTLSVAEGDSPDFSHLDEVEFGTGAVNWVQVSANPGGARSPLEVRVESIMMRAATLPGGKSLPGGSGKAWAWAAALALVVLGVSVALWWRGRSPRASRPEAKPAGAAKADSRPGPSERGPS